MQLSDISKRSTTVNFDTNFTDLTVLQTYELAMTKPRFWALLDWSALSRQQIWNVLKQHPSIVHCYQANKELQTKLN